MLFKHDKIAQRAAANNQSQHFNAGLEDILQVSLGIFTKPSRKIQR